MINYRCFNCDHECRLDSGSMFGPPIKCVVTAEDVEWVKVTDLSQRVEPPNKEVANEQAKNCILYNQCRYKDLPDCINDTCRHKPPVAEL